MANTNKITYSMALDYVLGLDLPTEIRDKVTDLKTSVEKKSTTKKSASQKDENKPIFEEITRVLENATSGQTVTEILTNGNFPSGTSSQKISAMLKLMPNVTRSINGKKSVFSIDTDDDVQALPSELSI